jgi:hypothetical protein
LRNFAAAALAALTLAGCKISLDLPEANQLAFVQPFRTAAPRQLLADLEVTGGAGGNRYAFAQGGQLSGDDATVDPGTGAYRAGSRGSAQDLVQVTDSQGKTALVRISVGAPLSVTPPIGGTAPGGHLAFTVSGGLPPYAVSLAPGGSSATAPGLSGAVLSYTAGATGPALDRVVVTDATLDPAAATTLEVSVGITLDVFASARTVAPYDSATVVGTGGQPLYTYRVKTDRSGGATITATGYYTAGGTGGVVDEIEVKDQNQQTTTFAMTVGPALSLRLDGNPPDPRPGVSIGLLAAGGRPPYAYRFARAGNRSGGTVDGTTGVYVPGPASGAVDLFEVTDQTGKAKASISNPTAVGATQLATGSGNRTCAFGDLDGDGIDDVLVANDGATRLVTEIRIGSGQPRVDPYPMTGTDGGTSFLAVEDLNGDGRAEVLLRTARGPMTLLTTDPLGQLADETVMYPALRFNQGLVVPVRDRIYGLRFLTNVDGGSGGFYEPCPNVGQVNGMVGPDFAGYCPNIVGFNGATIIGMAAGDFDGDGYADLAILRSGVDGSSNGNLYVAWGTGTGPALAQSGFDPVALATSAPLFPAGYSWPNWSDWGTPYARFVPVPAGPGHVGGLLVRVQDSSGQGWVVTARVDKATRTWTVNAPSNLRPDWTGPWGFVQAPTSSLPGSETLYVGYNLTDGHLLGVVLDPVSLVPREVALQPGPRASRIDCVTFPDVNGDGAPDLVAVGQFMATSDLLLGSGASTVPRPDTTPWFGDRVHRRGLGFPTIAADLDGDGLVDVVSWDGSGLEVLLGGGGQLGSLQRISNVLTMGIAAGRLFEPAVAGTAIVFHDHQQTFYAALPDGKGGFDPPYALTLTQSGGGTFASPVMSLYPTDLGGPALYTAGAVFLAKGPGDLLAVPMQPVPNAEHSDKCAYMAAPYTAGATSAAFLVACGQSRTPPNGQESDLAVYVATISGLDTASPSFGAWSLRDLWQNPNTTVRLQVLSALVGTARPLDGRPYFVAWNPAASELRITTFDPALVPTTQTVPYPAGLVSKTMGASTLAVSLRTGAPDDLLVTADGALLLVRRDGNGKFGIAQEIRGGVAMPVGTGLLAPGAPPFVITAGAGLFSGAAGTELVPVATEGGYLK